MQHKHKNGEFVATDKSGQLVAGHLVQFLVRNGEGSRFCWQDFLAQENAAKGLLYLIKITDRLPSNIRAQARKLVDDNIPESLVTRVKLAS